MARADHGGSGLDTNRVFTSLSLFALLQEPLTSFVTSLSSLVGSVGCFARIQSFLESDPRVDKRMLGDMNRDAGSRWSSPSSHLDGTEPVEKQLQGFKDGQLPGNSPGVNAIAVEAGAFGYDVNKDPILSSIDIGVPAGKLTMLVGPVGCGKSTLLKAFLGEVSITAGAIHTSTSRIAYCDQTPWHMIATIRDSIIAFSPVDERWYQRVVKACALEQDFDQLAKGDRTVIGSRGIVLSGGQSQRIVCHTVPWLNGTD